MLKNPFPTVNYQGAEFFCDREHETNQLLTNIKNGNSSTLMSIRRIGKTGLVQHVINKLPNGWQGIYVDILPSENQNQLLNLLATSIVQKIPEKSTFGKKTWNFIRSLRPTISFDALTGQPQASFDFKKPETENNISAVLNFINQQKFKTVIAIDEFQQIINYPETNTDSLLRRIIQQLKNVVFIFSGSQQHIISDLFASPSRPFFRSTQIMKLEKIPREIYKEHIINMFQVYKKQITEKCANEIIDWCNNHTYYVQVLCNKVFSASGNKVPDPLWKQQASLILKEQETIFFNYRNLLTKPQWQLLRAIAYENKVYMPTSSGFINNYNLGNGATVKRSLDSLLKNELIFKEYNEKGESYYSVYDIFFQQWVKEIL